MSETLDKYHTVKEVARELKLSERTIRSYIAEGKLQVIRVVDKTIRIPTLSIRKIIKKD